MGITTEIAPIVNNVKEYIGIYQTTGGDYGPILSAVVAKYSIAIYKDAEKLKAAMSELGATETQIAKVCIMTLVTGFREVLELNERTRQVDINRYVQNAVKETGFNAPQVLALTSAIAASLGIDVLSDYSDAVKGEDRAETAGFVVPVSIYEDELKLFDRKFSYGRLEKLEASEIKKLEVLAKAGISRAKFYLGYCLLKNEEFETNESIGLKYMEEAASDGDSLAAGVLGDYFYEQADSDSWSKAYSYYTGYGSLSLNKSRREKIVDILNVRKFNRTAIIAGILLVLIMLATVIFAPGKALFEPHRILGGICTAAQAAIVVLSVLHHRTKPYDNLSWLPCAIFIVWFLYILLRIIF